MSSAPPIEDTPRQRRLRLATLALALAALALVVCAGPLTRAGVPWRLGLLLLPVGAALGIAAVAIALVLVAVPKWRRPGPAVLLAALVAGALALLPVLMLWSKARGVPPIHDITTDFNDPPAFVALEAARKDAPNGAAYGGAEVAAKQRGSYPEVYPLVMKLPPAQAFQKALDAARASGWEVVASDAPSGRIEATDTTTWFGFKDDIVVRVRPVEGGSRIDVRSMSRVGRSDLGANAARVRAYLARLQ